MLNLFNSFYIMPVNMGYYPRSHSFYVAIKPIEGVYITDVGGTSRAKRFNQGDSISTCFAAVTPEQAMLDASSIVVLYADSSAYREYLTRFIKTVFPSIDKEMANNVFQFIWGSIKMTAYGYHLTSMINPELEYTIEDLHKEYFSEPIDIASAKPFDIELKYLGLDWLLYDALSLNGGQFQTQLEEVLKRAYTDALKNEINGVMGIKRYFDVDAESDDLETLAKQVGSLKLEFTTLCNNVHTTGTLRTVKQLMDNLKSKGDISVFTHRCEYHRSNTFLVWLAINSVKHNLPVPTIGT